MGKKILLVDDNETVLMWEKMMLTGTPYELTFARDGEEALECLAKQPVDLVLLDIMMPRLDGIETCRRLKQDPSTQHIPVVIVTTKGEPERVEAAFAAGCDDYITKPIDKMSLMARVKTYLE